MKDKPGAANRCLALLSKMFNLAEAWGLREDGTNPTRHVEKYPERRIERFLSDEELGRLGGALRVSEQLGEHPSTTAAVKLPPAKARPRTTDLLTIGCRRGEILKLTWGG